MKKDDLFWKALLEDIFDDFLLFFFKGLAAILDFSRPFEFLDKELEQIFPAEETGHTKLVDKLVKVYLLDGREEWILVHVEVQGYRDPDFAKRMFTYFYRILDKYDKYVTSIAIFTGSNTSQMPDRFVYSFMGVENIFKYNTYKIAEQDADALKNDDNPFALVILTALIALQKGRQVDEEILQLKKEILLALIKKPLPAKKVKGIMNFLRHYVRFEKPENTAKFEEAIITITGKNIQNMGTEEYLLQKARKEGREEGKEEGKQEGKQEANTEKDISFVKRLLADTDFDDERIASLAGVTVAFVRAIKNGHS